jgi:N-acetylglucosaminyldiphosphoundecaprenol N-acetyl-beta-D-mannosaminyltransferase
MLDVRISIIICVIDRWNLLKGCLESIARAHPPIDFEIIVIDDGSKKPVPLEIKNWVAPFTIKFTRQVPLGESAARNHGIQLAHGEIILFIDSDCVLDTNFFTNFMKVVDAYPQDVAYQARIIGHRETCVGLMENLRVSSVQQSLLTKDGHIKYVNTAAFAIRRSFIDQIEYFNLAVIRGCDTLVLYKLVTTGKLPQYVPDAIVKHTPPLSLFRYILKHFWIGYYTGPARQRLKDKCNIIMTISQRCKTFHLLRQIATAERTSGLYVFLVLFAYIVERFGRFAYNIFGMRCDRAKVLSTPVDPMREQELQARIISSAQHQKGMLVTYLTAWALIQSERNPDFRKLLEHSNLCYSDGIGVVIALLITKFRRIKKVTVNNFYCSLFEEISNRKLKIALVGGEKGVAESVASRIKQWSPFVDICMCVSGYFSIQDETILVDELAHANPNIVFLAMGQPLQEYRAYRWRQLLPNTVFYCVGGLFDVIIGKAKTPKNWVRYCGLEWLYRLLHSPSRLWRRYILGIPLLGIYIIRSLFISIVSFRWIAYLKLKPHSKRKRVKRQ